MNDNKTFFRKAEQKKLGWKDIFRDVFRRHTKEENARLFMAGTALTTPDEASMLSKWLRPYMFARLLLAGMLVILGAFVMFMMGYFLFLPFIFVAGSFLVPMTVMFFFWEMNIPRNISFPTVIGIFFIGGILSLIFTVILNPLKPSGGILMWIVTGVVEEVAKVLALMFWLKGKDKKYILTGMMVGAAVGAGFAAVESAGYAVVNAGWDLSTLILRALLTPGGHVTWAAISGGGLIWAKGGERLSLKHLFHPVFLSLFAFSMVTHGIWDIVASMLWPLFILQALIVVVAYMVMKRGVEQIVSAAVKQNDDRLTLALNHDIFAAITAGEAVIPEPVRPPDMINPSLGSGTQVRLVGVRGAFAGRRFALEGRVRMGRDPGQCDLVFPSGTSGVSKAHCEITYSGNIISIKDTGSTYGTFVNGVKLSPGGERFLLPGDRVCLGSPGEEFQIIVKKPEQAGDR